MKHKNGCIEVAIIMNTQIESLVAAFAKANKQSKAKLMSLIEQCVEAHVSTMPKQAVCSNAGRKASADTIKLRDIIRSLKPSLQGDFTAKTLAMKLGVNHNDVNNTLNFLATRENMFIRCGTQDKIGRGRKSVMWRAL